MAVGMFQLMNDLDDVFGSQLNQAFSTATFLNVWTTSNQNRTQLWLTNQDPNNSIEKDILGRLTNDSNNDHPDDFSAWLTEFTQAKYLNMWSLSMVMQVQTLVTQAASSFGGDAETKWNNISGTIGPYNNYLNSAMTQDTTVANTESQNVQSDLDQINTASTPAADAGSSFDQYLSSIANAMAGITA